MGARSSVRESEWQHWPLLFSSLLGIVLVTVQGYSVGVMMGPLEQEFGWTRAEISSGPFLVAMISLFVAPFVGAGIDRFGSRNVALVGVVVYCLAIASFATTSQSLMSWWLRWLLAGIGGMLIMPAVWTTAINHVFSKNRGLALAIALSGTGVGAAIMPYLINALVEAQGWRGAYVALAVISACVVLPVVFLFFRVRAPAKADDSSSTPPVVEGLAAREGFASASFIKLALAAFLFAAAVCTITTNGVPLLIGFGFNRATSAALAGLIGIGSIIGRLGGGYLLDRMNARLVAAFAAALPIAAILTMLMLPGDRTATSIALFLVGLSVGAEIDCCAYLAARLFGMRSFGVLFGTVNGMIAFANGLAPVGANAIFDSTGSYEPVLWLLIPTFSAVAVLFLIVGRYPETFDNPRH